MRERGALVRGLGPVAATALVAGNMIGSGIFVIPASLAGIAGPLSLVAWGIVAAGFLCLSKVYADLGSAYPISGGLQVYAQRAFGDFAGIETAFLYWSSVVIANAAYVTAFISYAAVFVPSFGSPLAAFGLAQALLWGFTLVNLLGVRHGGAIGVVTTACKLLPLGVLSVALFAHGSTANLVPFAPHGTAALLPAISLVAWMFLGSESITIPAEEVRGGGSTIRRSAFLGFAIATAAYVVLALAVSLAAPASEIARSASPLAALGRRVLGARGEAFVTAGALISIAGILNGSLLIVGRLPFAAARQGFAPAFLAHIHPATGTPAASLLVSTALSAILVLLYFSRTLLDAYNAIALASTATALVAIGVACAAQLALSRREPERFPRAGRRLGRFAALAGIAICALIIAGTGRTVWLLTLLAIALPAPYALWLRARSSRASGDPKSGVSV